MTEFCNQLKTINIGGKGHRRAQLLFKCLLIDQRE